MTYRVLGSDTSYSTAEKAAAGFLRAVLHVPGPGNFKSEDGHVYEIHRAILLGLEGRVESIVYVNISTANLVEESYIGDIPWEYGLDEATDPSLESDDPEVKLPRIPPSNEDMDEYLLRFIEMGRSSNKVVLRLPYWRPRTSPGPRAEEREVVGFLHIVQSAENTPSHVLLVEYLYFTNLNK